MSKKISFTAILVGVLLLSSMACVALGLRYAATLSEAERLQGYVRSLELRTMNMNRTRLVINSIFNEATEYSKKSPAMAALLQQYKTLFDQAGARARAAATPPTNSIGR